MVSSGHVKGELGDYEGALADLREGKRVLEPLFGSDHPSVVQCDMNEGRVLMLAGRWGEALPIYEAASARHADAPPGDRRAVDIDVAFAECLIELGQTARALAVLDRHALPRSVLAALRDRDSSDTSEIEAWLAKHDAAP